MEILTWAIACLGAILGAGFASGREIFSFFTRWGAWSWGIIGLCCLWMGILAWVWMGLLQHKDIHLDKGAASVLFGLLMWVTAGSMTAAAGEIVALCWPWQGGLEWGAALTLGAAVAMSRRGITALKRTSWLLLPGMIVLFAITGSVPSWEGVAHPIAGSPRMWWESLAYGGMNMMLVAPVLKEAQIDQKKRPMLAAVLGGLLMGLLCFGNGVLLKHPDLVHAPLPMIVLLRTQGSVGFYLGIAVMYLAVFTTLLTALQGMHQILRPCCNGEKGWAWISLGTLLVALAGFQRLVEWVYPFLGWLCMGWLVYACLKTSCKNVKGKNLRNPSMHGSRCRLR